MGAGSRQTHTATLPSGQFHCLLDELPLHLIPQRRLDWQRWRQNLSQQELFLNPQCSVLPPGQVPTDLESNRQLLKNFNLSGTVAWVRDPATRSLHPFWLSPRLEAAVSRLRAGEPAPDSLPKDERFLLAGVGILVPADHAERRRHATLNREHFHALYEVGLLFRFTQMLLACDFEDTAVQVAHHADELLDLIPGR